MTGEARPNIRTWSQDRATVHFGLKSVLVAQVVVATFLLLTDVQHRLSLQRVFEQEAPRTLGPISPGDQIRRHEPALIVPRYVDPGDEPTVDLPEALPTRLSFSLEDAGEYGQVLFLNGTIVRGDAERFDAFLVGLSAIPDQVAVNSPGGNVDEALMIGRRLREQEVNTVILPGMACFSACPYILAGGAERWVSLRGLVGLHQHFYEAPGYMPVFFAVGDIQHNQARTMEYLIEMGIDPRLMIFGLSTPPDDIYILVEAELIETGLATQVQP
jgi:hypothetical protein